ncbi:MAG: TatD family hydrolase [Negativicutes bacterium]|nr:TatD family hydrolase [Negativicutes bacterium]
MRLIDTHVHLDDERFGNEMESVLARAAVAGVEKLIQVGCNLPSSYQAVALAGRYAQIYPAVGIHPSDAAGYPAVADELAELAAKPEVVAIGEIGLDYYWNQGSKEVQREAFVRQLDLAGRLHKPVIIHDRDAHGDMMELLRRQAGHFSGGVLHCFSGSWEMAEVCLNLGFYLSFAGPLTFPKSNRLRQIAARIPLDRFLLETDCPYLAPQAHRGQRNEPAYVAEQAIAFAAVRGLTADAVAEQAAKNAEKLFGI